MPTPGEPRGPRIPSVSSRAGQRLAAWLGLAVAVLMGLAPAVGLVLCVDPAGTFGVESATEAGRCRACVVAEVDGSTDREPAQVELHSECPCIDLPLLAARDGQKVAPQSVRLELHAITALPVRFDGAPACVRGADRSILPAAQPRAPPQLASIRTVVLLV